MPRIRPGRFVHVVYRTRRFDEMVRWYQTVFDARVQHRDPALAFLTYDDEHHRFAFANLDVLQPGGGEHKRRGAIGVDHVAYTYASIGELLENYAQLKALGIEPYWCIHHGITVSTYYADPDGNQMEFQVEAMAPAEANDFMRGPRFAQNPIGVEYDPADWLARWRTGEPAASFMTRAADLPVSPVRGSAIANPEISPGRCGRSRDVRGQDVESADPPVAGEASKDVSGGVSDGMCTGGGRQASDEGEGSKDLIHGVRLVG
jgi:catechol 2,3-dioxygenase-like lactoylglutathione lyase family enzyme